MGRATLVSNPRRGEIYLVRLPGHPSDLKKRPALVVSMDVRNRLANDVIVVPLSTTLRPAPTHVEIPAGEGGLTHPYHGEVRAGDGARQVLPPPWPLCRNDQFLPHARCREGHPAGHRNTRALSPRSYFPLIPALRRVAPEHEPIAVSAAGGSGGVASRAAAGVAATPASSAALLRLVGPSDGDPGAVDTLAISGAAKPPPVHRLGGQPCPLAVGEKGLSTVAIGASGLSPRGSCPRSRCSADHESAAWFGRNQRTWILTHSLPGTSRGVLISRRG
ncbi:MAG TPA: hypothetical protein DCQ64_05615 [Candidatus Rokubacteria bacterium]|nr:hypothetical protein [Candidatus Rokubacteria bacterium]